MFRVIAPDAGKIRVRVGAGFDMTKGPDDIWTVTTSPLVPGFHYYTLQIDGANVADPSTLTFFGSGWWNSGIETLSPTLTRTITTQKMFRTGTWASSRTTQRSLAGGGGHLFTRRRITDRT
jgi:hypothetical protein